MDSLQRRLLDLIRTTCNLEDISPNTMGPDDPLIGPESPLGTDSIDALEIAVTIQKEYGLRMDSENSAREVLQSLSTLADFIRSNQNPG